MNDNHADQSLQEQVADLGRLVEQFRSKAHKWAMASLEAELNLDLILARRSHKLSRIYSSIADGYQEA